MTKNKFPAGTAPPKTVDNNIYYCSLHFKQSNVVPSKQMVDLLMVFLPYRATIALSLHKKTKNVQTNV